VEAQSEQGLGRNLACVQRAAILVQFRQIPTQANSDSNLQSSDPRHVLHSHLRAAKCEAPIVACGTAWKSVRHVAAGKSMRRPIPGTDPHDNRRRLTQKALQDSEIQT